jgi:hypothetical protein
MMLSLRFVPTAVLALVVAACGCSTFSAPTKKSSKAAQERAMKFSPPEGKVGIYVLRPYQFVAAGLPAPLFLDHATFGQLPPHTFLYCEVLARDHVLELAEVPGAKSASLRFKTEAGRCYFFRARVVLGGFSIKPLSEEEGRKQVRKLELSGDSVFEAQVAEPNPIAK